jgi:hypothetical protein
MDLVAIFRVATAHTRQQPSFPDDGDTKDVVATGHKAQMLACRIVS